MILGDMGIVAPYWAMWCYWWFVETDEHKIDRYNNFKPWSIVP